ncbi:hypothetical protein cyc_05219 [Cyclospora cayetanensis]|uniref:Uncharacterized protein n=1 Tax=Cyclospora cayetanensis TaxID=88456 RepID=A0A1D3CRN4_9EIME|nr:hypothetical protein cyc_05219 [Cyclospora cayetanensis]
MGWGFFLSHQGDTNYNAMIESLTFGVWESAFCLSLSLSSIRCCGVYVQLKGPQTLDGFRLQFPAASDASIAAAAEAATPTTAEDEAFQQQIQRTLSLVKDCTLTIRDAQDSRKRQSMRVQEVQQSLQRLARGQELEPSVGISAHQQSQAHLQASLTNARARIARLYEKEWNKTVQLQEAFLLLAEKLEERMCEALLRHCKCRQLKLSIDRAYAEKKAGLAAVNKQF